MRLSPLDGYMAVCLVLTIEVYVSAYLLAYKPFLLALTSIRRLLELVFDRTGANSKTASSFNNKTCSSKTVGIGAVSPNDVSVDDGVVLEAEATSLRSMS